MRELFKLSGSFCSALLTSDVSFFFWDLRYRNRCKIFSPVDRNLNFAI